MVGILRISKAHTICSSCKKARLTGVIYIVRTEKVAFICHACHEHGETPHEYQKQVVLKEAEGKRLKFN